MTNRSLHPLLHYLRRLKSGKAGDSALDDTQLLHRFLSQRDESAFTTIVQRYGAMVWGLCVRRLGETPEAEDAFQATFLVLVRKAASLRGPQLLGPWLYGVAYRTALKLRCQRARRAARETPLPQQIADERPAAIDSDLSPILDEEINRLPTKYRLPVLLCYVQGLSSDEAAQRLGCAKGTVFSRLSRARDLLRRRLVRRGVDVTIGALATVLTENTVLRAAPSLALREITIRTSLLLAAGTAGQTLSAPLAALVEGVVRSMFLSKVKFVALVVLAVGITGAGTGFLGYRTAAEPPAPKEKNVRPAPVASADVAISSKEKNDESKPGPLPAASEKEHRLRDLRDKLMQPVDYPGCDDNRATLSDALDHVAKRYNLTFDINEKAFEMDQLKDVARTPIADPTAIPPMRATLAAVLRKILRRVPAPSGATFLIRRDVIEITTETAVRIELGIPAKRPLLTLVWDDFEETSLVQALPRLAETSGYNVIADPKAGDLLQAKITAKLNNVPIDTAVRLLANMAGLSMVRLDNVLYVATADNAKRLREEQAEINADKPAKNAEPPKKPKAKKPAK